MKFSPVLINGQRSDGLIPVTDSSVLRGDGCFEVLKAYQGRPFRLDLHLDRLERSASRLQIQLPDRDLIARWIGASAAALGDCAVRVVVTRGSALEGLDDPPRVIVFGYQGGLEKAPARLYPLVAPWHGAGVEWDLAGAKTLSYAPNLSATRHAQQEGFDDALLLTVEDVILEGPTYSVGWVIGGIIETPSLSLGILDSITRRVVLEEARRLEIEVVEGSWTFDRIGTATEVIALSTIREVQPVTAVGDLEYAEGPIASRLAAAFDTLVS